MLCDELPEPDCPPVRTRLYGEDLVAFRDSTGQVGIVAENCPHRGASLFFGRNEEAGLRCVYHGWKFSADGTCVDMPNEPPESNFKHKVRVTAYPAREAGGFIWTYMGPTERRPDELPHMEWMDVSPTQRSTAKLMYESNFVQSIEGEIDTVHASILHARLDAEERAKTATGLGQRYMYSPRWARFTVKHSDGGIFIGAARPATETENYWRISHWLYPFFTLIPRDPGTPVRCGMWVPRDDETTWILLARWHPTRALAEVDESSGGNFEIDASRNLIPGSWIPTANKSNDYLIDREEQRTTTFTGITQHSGRAQDAAMVESMGPIYDRSHERLGTTDAAIIQMRRCLLKAARDLAAGAEPHAATHPELYHVRSGGALLPKDMLFPDQDEATRADLLLQQQ